MQSKPSSLSLAEVYPLTRIALPLRQPVQGLLQLHTLHLGALNLLELSAADHGATLPGGRDNGDPLGSRRASQANKLKCRPLKTTSDRLERKRPRQAPEPSVVACRPMPQAPAMQKRRPALRLPNVPVLSKQIASALVENLRTNEPAMWDHVCATLPESILHKTAYDRGVLHTAREAALVKNLAESGQENAIWRAYPTAPIPQRFSLYGRGFFRI